MASRGHQTEHVAPTSGPTSRGGEKKPPPAADAASLVVFDVPAFTARFTAKASKPDSGFVDLAWAADSKVLYAIDSLGDTGEVRRWEVPAFTEQPAISDLQTGPTRPWQSRPMATRSRFRRATRG